MSIENLYITKLWKTSRILFTGILLFALGQAYFTYKGILNFPFFPYEMYSYPVTKPSKADITHVYVNDSIFNYTQLPDWNEGTLLNTVRFYNRYQHGNNWAMQIWKSRFGSPDTDFKELIYHRIVPSDTQMSGFPHWLAVYIENSINIPVKSISISKKEYHYEHQQLVPAGQETILLDYRR